MKKAMTGCLLTTVWLLFGFNALTQASVPATGEFTFTKTCQAYQSIRRKTNPGEIRIEIGRSYPIMELNVSPGTTWYRLRIKNASPEERWVYFECGNVKATGQADITSNQEREHSEDQCQTAGLGNSYVFALSWQPAYCERHKNKPECGVTDPRSYQANNFTLHGLWPNKESCGINYGFCGKYKSGQRPFCSYDPVPMQNTTREALAKVMPSSSHGSCLQRHEWYKHGTCQEEWDADAYYDTAIRLLKEFNESGISAFMTNNIGKTVTTRSFFEAVDTAFGEGSHRRMQISCSGGKLVDVKIHLPSVLPECTSLGTLIQRAEPNFNNRCGTSFEVDPIGQL